MLKPCPTKNCFHITNGSHDTKHNTNSVIRRHTDKHQNPTHIHTRRTRPRIIRAQHPRNILLPEFGPALVHAEEFELCERGAGAGGRGAFDGCGVVGGGTWGGGGERCERERGEEGGEGEETHVDDGAGQWGGLLLERGRSVTVNVTRLYILTFPTQPTAQLATNARSSLLPNRVLSLENNDGNRRIVSPSAKCRRLNDRG